jgi:hypothetical protein
MARIPTPRLAGQEVGSVQIQGTPTPFQNLQTNADMFGAAQGRQLSQAGAALGQASDALIETARTDDKVDQQRMDAEVKEFTVERQNYINGLAGQEKLDYLKTAQADYEAGVANITGKYKMRLSSSNDVTEVFSQNTNTTFLNFVGSSAKQARDVVAQQTTATGIANAVTAASRATANPDSVARNTSYNKALAEAERLVRDPDIGLAKQAGDDPTSTDPAVKARVDLLVRETKMQVADGIVTSLLADGKFEQAVNLLDQPAMQDIGEGTKAYSALEAKVLPFREKVLGMKEFAAMRSSSAKPDGTAASLAELQSAISQETDPLKRSRLQTEFSVYSSATTSVLNEKVKQQGDILIQALTSPDGVTPQVLAQIPDYLARNPQAALALATGRTQRTTAEQVAKSAEAQAHISSGGGAGNLPGLEGYMVGMFNTNAPQATALVRSGALKQYFDVDTYDAMSQKAAVAEAAISRAQSKNPTNAATIMSTYFGYSRADATKLISRHNTRFLSAVKRVEDAAIAAGKPVDPDAVRKAVAEVLVRVRTEDGFFKDEYDLSVAIDQSKLDAGFDPYDAVLQRKDRNDRVVGFLFDRSEGEIKMARAALDDRDQEYTLNNVATYFGVQTLPELRSLAAKEQAFEDLATDAGLPPDFVEYYLKIKGLALDKAAQEIPKINDRKNAEDKAYLLKEWLSRNG